MMTQQIFNHAQNVDRGVGKELKPMLTPINYTKMLDQNSLKFEHITGPVSSG